MLAKVRFKMEQKFVRVTEPKLDVFLNAGECKEVTEMHELYHIQSVMITTCGGLRGHGMWLSRTDKMHSLHKLMLLYNIISVC